MSNIGTTEIIFIVLVILVLFGSTAIPRFARSLGQAKSEFEKGLRESRDHRTPERHDDKSQPPSNGSAQ